MAGKQLIIKLVEPPLYSWTVRNIWCKGKAGKPLIIKLVEPPLYS